MKLDGILLCAFQILNSKQLKSLCNLILNAHLFHFSGCYGTLGMESGVIPDSHITASSILEWSDQTGQVNIWKPENARLKRTGPPWAAFINDEHQWLQIDLNKEKRITGK